MPRQSRRQRRLQAQMNVVPYIDVMLVLLIIFMMTSPMLSLQGIDVELPAVAATAVETQTHLPILLKITRQGEYLLTDGDFFDQPYTAAELPQLGAYVLLLSQREPQRPIVLHGDKEVAYGKVVELMAFLEGHGVKVRLMTRPPTLGLNRLQDSE